MSYKTWDVCYLLTRGNSCYNCHREICLGYEMNNALKICLAGYFLLSLILWAFAGFAYHVNSKREDDDPMKKDFCPAAIFMVPLWPFYPLLVISLYILGIVFLAVFLVLFTVGLVFIRKPIIITWLKKLALKVGNKFLQVNTVLLNTFFPRANPRKTQ